MIFDWSLKPRKRAWNSDSWIRGLKKIVDERFLIARSQGNATCGIDFPRRRSGMYLIATNDNNLKSDLLRRNDLLVRKICLNLVRQDQGRDGRDDHCNERKSVVRNRGEVLSLKVGLTEFSGGASQTRVRNRSSAGFPYSRSHREFSSTVPLQVRLCEPWDS